MDNPGGQLINTDIDIVDNNRYSQKAKFFRQKGLLHNE